MRCQGRRRRGPWCRLSAVRCRFLHSNMPGAFTGVLPQAVCVQQHVSRAVRPSMCCQHLSWVSWHFCTSAGNASKRRIFFEHSGHLVMFCVSLIRHKHSTTGQPAAHGHTFGARHDLTAVVAPAWPQPAVTRIIVALSSPGGICGEARAAGRAGAGGAACTPAALLTRRRPQRCSVPCTCMGAAGRCRTAGSQDFGQRVAASSLIPVRVAATSAKAG